jgi:hypothetical protein
MAELKKTLDSVTMEHMELSKQMNSQESDAEKTKLAFMIGQADAKVQGLSVLMLHYCSSLQQTQEKIVLVLLVVLIFCTVSIKLEKRFTSLEDEWADARK